MQHAVSACLSHLVAMWLSFNMECTSTVLFTIFRTNCYSHVLIISGKCDLFTDGQGNEDYCSWTSLFCKPVICFIQKNEDEQKHKSQCTYFMCKNAVVIPSLKRWKGLMHMAERWKLSTRNINNSNKQHKYFCIY